MAALAFLFATLVSLPAQGQDYELSWFTFDSGGGASRDGFFALDGTMGQADAETMSDGYYLLQGGFWPGAMRVPPFVGAPPLGTKVSLGDTVTFTNTSAGTPPFRYQWRLNGVNLPGETNATLTLHDTHLVQGGAYTWVAVNAYGTVNSGPAELEFTLPQWPPPPVQGGPSNDHFTNRLTIELTNTTFTARNVGATRETGEPNHAGKLGGASVWYTWSTNANGIATFHTRGSGFDTVLAVYTGDDLATLELVADDDDLGGFLTSEVQFNVTAGTAYHLALDGLGGSSGSFVLSWELMPTPDKLPLILRQPRNRAVRPYSSTVFSAGTIQPGLSYQWYFKERPVLNATHATLTLSNALVGNLGFYYVAVTNAERRGVLSRRAALEFGSRSNAVSYAKLEDLLFEGGLLTAGGGGGSSRAARGLAAASASLMPDNFESVSVGVSGFQRFSNQDGTSSGQCNRCDILGGSAKYYGLVAADSGALVIDTMGSDFDTVLSVFQFQYPSAFQSDPCTYHVACDNDSGPDGVSSRLSIPAVAGYYYVVEVDGVNGEQGEVALNWALSPAPSPFELVGDGLYLNADTDLTLYRLKADYHWFTNGALSQSTTGPWLLQAGPFIEAVTYDVVVNTGNGSWLTNNLGSFVASGIALESDTNATTLQLVLDLLLHPDFQVEAAPAPGTNSAAAWQWQTVTNYDRDTNGGRLILRFRLDDPEQPALFYRVRPKSE